MYTFYGLRFCTHLQVVSANGKEHVLVGSLDLNQGLQLPGELSGSQPEVCKPPYLADQLSLCLSELPKLHNVTPLSTASLHTRLINFPFQKTIVDVVLLVREAL